VLRSRAAVISILFVIPAACLAIWFANVILVGGPLKKAVLSDSRNQGVIVDAHFEHFINPNVLVYNLKGVAPTNSRLDVLRVFLLFAEQEKAHRFTAVKLDCNGRSRYFIRGTYFQQLGQMYATENPLYIMRMFPTNVFTLDGRQAFKASDGGLMGMIDDLKNATTFIDRWCFSDLVGRLSH
jgi:hypothetical protein